MQIAINCRSFLGGQYTGIGRYAYHLVKSLSDIDSRNEYQLYARKGLFQSSKKLPHFKAKNFIPRIDWLGRGPTKILKNIDIYHSPSPDIWNVDRSVKSVVTVHDVIFKAFPQGHTQQTIETGERQFEYIKEKASKIICCSKNTAQDLKKYFQISEDRMALVYQGVDKNVFYLIGAQEEALADQTLKRRGVDGSFILSVGTIEPRKNLVNLIHAFHALRDKKKFLGKLVVVGMRGWMNDDIGALIKKLDLTSHIVFLGYLTDQELRYFYNKAEVFAFPSFYEGFGFPIVEAFCCGVPVVTSNVSSCPEIAEDAALTIDPHNPQDIADAIASIVDDDSLKRALREKGFKRAGDFNFRKTAEETLKIYEETYGFKG